MKRYGSARSSAKAKRLCKIRNGAVDASGWTQPHESATPRMRRAYKQGGRVGEMDKDDCGPKRADKRPRKLDGGPLTSNNDPRATANEMMQNAASIAPVSGQNPIPTYTSNAVKKSPLRGGFKRGGKAEGPELKKPMPKVGKEPANCPKVPKKAPLEGTGSIMPDQDYGPPGGLKKGGRACKADGGALERDGYKKGGRVKGKTNINIVIAPQAPADHPAPAPQMGPPGMPRPPMPPAPPAGGPPGAQGAPGMQPPANPLAGMPPQAIAAMMGGGAGGSGPQMPPHLPMRANGGRILRAKAGAGSGEGRLEKTSDAAKRGRGGL